LLGKEFHYLMSVILNIIYFEKAHYYIPFTYKDLVEREKKDIYLLNLLYIRKVKRYVILDMLDICFTNFHLLNFELVFLEHFKDILDPLY
jgi:hypothetical protein